MRFKSSDHEMVLQLIHNLRQCGYTANIPDHEFFRIYLEKDGEMIGGIGNDGAISLLVQMDAEVKRKETEKIQDIMIFTFAFKNCPTFFREQRELMSDTNDCVLTVGLNSNGKPEYYVHDDSAFHFSDFPDPHTDMDKAIEDFAEAALFEPENYQTRRRDNDFMERYVSLLKDSGFKFFDAAVEHLQERQFNIVYNGEPVAFFDYTCKLHILTQNTHVIDQMFKIKAQAHWEFDQVTDFETALTKKIDPLLISHGYETQPEWHRDQICLMVYKDNEPCAAIDRYDQLSFYTPIPETAKNELCSIYSDAKQEVKRDFYQGQRRIYNEVVKVPPSNQHSSQQFTQSEKSYILGLLNTNTAKDIADKHGLNDVAASIAEKFGGSAEKSQDQDAVADSEEEPEI